MSQIASASPPTERVLDIIELLAYRDSGSLNLSELARTLGISTGTAHAIIKVMCERGWVSRNPADKSLSIGPALGLAALQTPTAGNQTQAARAAALELASELGCAASVTVLSGHQLELTFFGGGDYELPDEIKRERIPFSAPFGPAFAAWASAREKSEWIARSSVVDHQLVSSLERFLGETRQRGYSVERTTPSLAQAAKLIQAFNENPWSKAVRNLINETLSEIATIAVEQGSANSGRQVTSISAPVFDHRGRVALNIAIHPLATISSQQITKIGQRLVDASQVITSGS